VNRAVLALAAVVAAAGFAAASAMPTRADNGTPSVTTTTTTTTPTTTTSPTTTTAPTTTQATPKAKPVKHPAAVRTTARVETVFPAAGDLVVNTVAVRRSPNPHAAVIRLMHQFRTDYRIQVILAVATRTGSDHKPWYRINLPMRPNGTYGWIPARTVSLTPTVSEIEIHRAARTIDVYWHGKRAWHGIVAIGAPGMETPVGHFYVASRFVPYQEPFLGVFAVETSAYSKLSEWPGGGVVGVHGTSAPQLLGQAVSHGCVRVSNETATALKRLAPLGTPITITD
jgi:lipoprotein-anchoring transpeptidase ErfK/SrfK